jgi:hypothetical protein
MLGFIELKTPVWNHQNSIVEYSISEATICQSDQFGSLETKVTDSILMLAYTDYQEGAQITIVCSGWRNPNLPSPIEGFYLRTYDQHQDEIIDSSDMFILDASSF